MKNTGERLLTDGLGSYGIFEHLHRYALAIELARGKVVLDIASGEGYGTNLLSSVAARVYGVDLSEETIAHAQSKYKRRNLSFQTGSADSIPLDANSVDLVVSFETLEHHDRHDEMFREVVRVLKPGGMLLLSSPEHTIYPQRDPDNRFHIKELNLDELKELVSRHFAHAKYFLQRCIVGTLVTAEVDSYRRYKLYDGDYEKVQDQLSDHPVFNRAYFNMVLCSGMELLDNAIPDLSFFNASKAYDDILAYERERVDSVLRSRRYQLAELLSSPVRLMKELMHRAMGSGKQE